MNWKVRNVRRPSISIKREKVCTLGRLPRKALNDTHLLALNWLLGFLIVFPQKGKTHHQYMLQAKMAALWDFLSVWLSAVVCTLVLQMRMRLWSSVYASHVFVQVCVWMCCVFQACVIGTLISLGVFIWQENYHHIYSKSLSGSLSGSVISGFLWNVAVAEKKYLGKHSK